MSHSKNLTRNALISVIIALSTVSCGNEPEQAETAPVQVSHEETAVDAGVHRSAYFGDLHLHTGLSFDAAAAGTRTMPADSYRFAMGEKVVYFGREVRRKVPLDFLAVTDHAEYLGVATAAADPEGMFAGTKWPARLNEAAGDMLAFLRIFSASGFRGGKPIPEFLTDNVTSSNWNRIIEAADKYYQPGKFTTFVAFEWSPMPGGAHLHRNVILRGPEYPARPFSAIDSMAPEDLWTWVESNRDKGIDSILIPHNSNLSEGLMFSARDSNGEPVSRSYARRRVENERLVEITQIKGTSETRPRFSPEDEFADFELITFNQDGEFDLAGGYIRPALRRGLEIQSEINANPFKFGLAGSSDFHSGISASEESNYPGGLGSGDEQSSPARVLTSVNPLMRSPTTILSASGLTGIWAEQNTRESLFDALRRREVFATSGSRIRIRMFAGWDYPEGMTGAADWTELAYETGVPMGADIPPDSDTGTGGALRFLLQAVKDPDGANLERIQIIKIWYADGQSHEKIFDVAWSGDRSPDPDTGHLPFSASTVDLDRATYTNEIGAAELRAEWTDAEFDPEVPALYYARVLEIPTPRWTTYLAVRNALPLPDSVPPVIRERAWTSPVFYTPGNR